ncbi:MAG: hypothetical protein Q9162_007354 [Coniocarpon cinnabarinum]
MSSAEQLPVPQAPPPINGASLGASNSSLKSGEADSDLQTHSRRLASMAKDLRPSDSTGTMPNVMCTDIPSAERPVSGTIAGQSVKEQSSFHSLQKLKQNEDKNLHDSIAKFEELSREAVYLAHDAADRQRPEEVSRIMGEVAEALQLSTHKVNTQRDQQIEPLLKFSGTAPYPRAQHPGQVDTASISSDSSTISVSQQHALPQSPGPRELSGSPARFRDEPSPYRPLTIVTPNAIDFAYNAKSSSDQVSPSSIPTFDVRRRSRPKTRFEAKPVNGEDVQSPLSTSPHAGSRLAEHGIPSILPRQSSLTTRRPEESDKSTSSPSTVEVPSELTSVGQTEGHNWGRDKYEESDFLPFNALDGKHHVTLADNQIWSIHHHRRQPIARNWTTARKRITALIVCLNTALIGSVIGIYAGEVPAIQYSLDDLDHHVILGNVVLFLGMSLTTFLCWPLPLLHGRKPYSLVALGILLPLQFPQAIMVGTRRVGNNSKYMAGLLIPRAISGLALGFCHINLKTTLLDVFGASLQSTHPHGEFVVTDDIRRHGGGVGLWLGFWSFCFIGSLSFGFMIGADIVSSLNVSWGFYVTVILIAVVLFLDVLTPETRRAPHRRTMAEIELPNMRISRRVARGEICMHVYGDGPKWWWEEVSAGIYLALRMLDQPGFGLMAIYLGWVYGEIVLIIVLLGNLLSVGYVWRPEYVGLGVLSICVGALLAIPNTKANFFSKSRVRGSRTDSMTFEPRLTWTSHMVRRAAFMILLPVAGIAYTLASAGTYIHYMTPIVLAGLIGYISNLAIAECHGLIMESFDTSDLQPGANSRHRLQSLPAETRGRRTAYSSYPRVTAGLMISHTIGFSLAAIATGVGGAVTRQIGAQKATGITAGVLFGLTLLLTVALWRWKRVQVIPDHLFGSNFGAGDAGEKRNSLASTRSDQSWRAVIVGNPSGKFRRMNLLELGGLSRWTEIRRLNRLLNRSTTQPLNEGWQ